MEKTTYQGALGPVLLDQNYLGDQIKKNEMDMSDGAYEKQDRCTKGFGRET